MKAAIIFYSFTGVTKKVADLLKGYLAQKAQVSMVQIKDLENLNSFFKQGKYAFTHKRSLIEAELFDLGGFDIACFGTPVWSFTSTPPMNSYLDKCTGLADKPVLLFTTSGGMGDERAIKYMQGILAQKGVKEFKSFCVQQGKAKDREFILAKIKAVMPLSPNG